MLVFEGRILPCVPVEFTTGQQCTDSVVMVNGSILPLAFDLDLRLRPHLNGHFFDFEVGGFDAV